MDPLEDALNEAQASGDLPPTPAISFSHKSDPDNSVAPIRGDGEAFDSYIERVFEDMPEGGVVEAGSSSEPSGPSGRDAQMDEVLSLLREILQAVQNGLSV